MEPAPDTIDRSARPRIVVVMDVYARYERRVVKRLSALASDAGFDVLAVCGGALAASLEGRSGESAPGAPAFDALIGGMRAAGAIVMAGALGQELELTQVERFLARLRALTDVPIVSVTTPACGIASVGGSDSASLRALVEHATVDSARRRFAFLRGHPSSHDSLERERVFREVLNERGLPIDDQAMLDAAFRPSEAYRQVAALLATGYRPDGIVAASDAMAAAAVRALNRHGLRVPEDVIVTGFDDSEHASLSSPPLTTVRLPVEEQIEVAFELLQRQLAGWQVPADGHHVVLPGALVRRKSTGCHDGSRHPSIEVDEPCTAARFGQRIHAMFESRSAPRLANAHRIADEIARALLEGDGDPLPMLREALMPDADGTIGVHRWRHVQDALDGLIRGPLGQALAPDAARTLSHIHGTIGEAVRNEEQQHELDRDTLRDAVEALHLALGRCTRPPQVNEALSIGLATLGVDTVALCLYPDEVGHGPAARAVPEFLWHGGQKIPLVPQSFQTAEMVPPALASMRTLVVVPVHVAGLHYGFLVHDVTLPAGVSMDGVAQSIANALQNCRHIGSLQEKAHEMRSANADLARRAGRDALTGLLNRAGFEKALSDRIGIDADENGGSTVLYFDLDGFKAINDTHGHAAGDRLLRAVAARVRRSLRAGDTIARLGGDEFTVILPGIADRDAAAGIARLLLTELSRPIPIGQVAVNLSASIGIARFPDDGEDGEALLRHADAAMYRAKAEGRNRYAWFCRSIEQSELDRLELDRALRQALGAGELSLAWQPRVALEDGRLLGFEALLRWHSESSVGRTVGPGEFVALAERTGYVCELDAFALDAACRQQAIWQAAGHRVRVSVNLSAASLKDDGLIERVRRTLAEHELAPGSLELELGESAAMHDVERTIRRLRALRELGLHLSIDDFGSAYSSLGCLERLPVDSLKIDRSFVRAISETDGDSGTDGAIARAIVAMARELGFAVVAEGIETETQRDFFAAIDCDEAQGYLFGRPMDRRAADARLESMQEHRRAA